MRSTLTRFLKGCLKPLVPDPLHPGAPTTVVLVRDYGQPGASASNLALAHPRVVTLPAVDASRPEALERESSSNGRSGASRAGSDAIALARMLSVQRAFRLQFNDRIRLMVLIQEDQPPVGDLRQEIRRGRLLLAVLPWLNSIQLQPSGILLTTRKSGARILSRLKLAAQLHPAEALPRALAPQLKLPGRSATGPH